MVETLAHAQRMSALERANAVRTEKAVIKRRLKAGDLMMDKLLAELPPVVRKLPIATLLKWGPGLRGRDAHKKISLIMAGVVTDGSMPAELVPASDRWALGVRANRYQRTRVPR